MGVILWPLHLMTSVFPNVSLMCFRAKLAPFVADSKTITSLTMLIRGFCQTSIEHAVSLTAVCTGSYEVACSFMACMWRTVQCLVIAFEVSSGGLIMQ